MPSTLQETLKKIDNVAADMSWTFAGLQQHVSDSIRRPVRSITTGIHTRATTVVQRLEAMKRSAAQYRTVKHVEKLLFADPPLSLLSVSFTLQDRRFHALPDEGKAVILEAFAQRVLMDPQDEIERTLAENFLNKRAARRNNNMA